MITRFSNLETNISLPQSLIANALPRCSSVFDSHFPPFSFCSSILFFFLWISYSLSDFAVNNVDSTSISLNPLPSLSSKKEKEFPSSLLHKGFFILYTKRFSLSLLKMSFFFHFLIQSPFHPFSFFLSHTGPDQRKNV